MIKAGLKVFFIRNVSSVNAFKKALKTHIFQKAFPSLFIVFILFFFYKEGFINRVLKNN